MAKLKSFKDIIQKDRSGLIDSITKTQKYVRHDFQDLGYRIAVKLNDLPHRSLYMRLAKTRSEAVLTQAMSFALDYPLKYGNNRARIFMWKLKELKDKEPKTTPTETEKEKSEKDAIKKETPKKTSKKKLVTDDSPESVLTRT
ncbi:MAG: hypothetical protein WCO33_02915 [bacterium]